ncbi:ESCRT-0 subunit protein hse1 [Mortierella alpina]|uniref:ESCRT-0 subunit protein hse1 n=1 Tax=Mortierella alpina TaxID=64518 RepID=A0A9P6LZP3_MORAP|nr:ESCRT-0 subunit protein hse1 [Mortierella alpina]
MSSSVAHAACDHIVQSLHGHIAFLKDQGAISDESLRIASIDTDLQMLDLPSKKDSEDPSSSDPQHGEQGGHGSDSDYDLDQENDLKQQERLLQQEQQLDHQSGDIVTGELDNLVAASATDDQDLEDNDHEVTVLEGADDIDDDDDDEEEQEIIEVQKERSLSPAGAPAERALSASSSPPGSASKAPSADLATAAGTATGLAAAAALASASIGHHSEPHSHAVDGHAQSPASTTAAPATVAELNSPLVSSAADAAHSKQSEHSYTTSAATPVDIPSAHSLPSSNLEHSEQRNTSVPTTHPADHEHHHQQYAPVPAATTTAAVNSTVYAPVYGHTYHPSAVADTPQHQTEAASGTPTVYSPPISHAPVSPAPVVYQPQVFSPPQHQQSAHLAHQSTSQTPVEGGDMSIADILEEMDHDQPKEHAKERSFPHHIHDASATTMVSTEGKGSVTSVESGKLSEHHPPTPPPKDNAPVTYQPPTTVDVPSQSAAEASASALVTPTPTPFTNANPIMPQPLTLPVQAYQLYKPKPYQPQSKPSTKIRPQTQQTPASAEQAPTGQSHVDPHPSVQPQAHAPLQTQFSNSDLSQYQQQPPQEHQQQQQQQQQIYQQQYHLQQQYQAQQQQQQNQQQQMYLQNQQQQQPLQHPPIHTVPGTNNTFVAAGGPPSASSSVSESAKPAGKGWMSAIRSSLLKEAKKDGKDGKDVKDGKDGKDGKFSHPPHQESFPQGQPTPFAPIQGQHVLPQPQFAQGQAPMSLPSTSGQPSLMQANGGSMPGNAEYAHTSAPAPGHSRQEGSSSEQSTPFQQQQQYQQSQLDQQPLRQGQQHQQGHYQSQQQQQPGLSSKAAADPPAAQQQQQHEQEHHRQQYEQYQQQQQQQQHSAVASPAVTVPTAKDSGHAEPIPASAVQDQSSRRLSSLSNSSFNGAAFRPETLGAATAASAAIQAARRSTTSSPLQSHNARNEGASNPYQIPQEQQQPMVQQQEHRQQVPGSPASEAGSRLSTLSTVSEVRNLQVIARAQAMFDFAGEDEGDLPFKVGDIINVIEYLNADWWRGILRKDVGIFPTAYVQELKPPTSGKYPTISVSVRQSVLIPSPTDMTQPEQEAEPSANHLQQQASFRASYQPSLAEDHAASSAPTTPQVAAPISNPGNAPFQSTSAAPMNASSGGAPTPVGGPAPDGAVQGSSSFPAPPPPPANSQSPPSVYTYFPGSGNQPPISPPPSMRNASQRLGFGAGQSGIPGQQAPGLGSPVTMPRYSQGGPVQQQQQQQPMSPLSPQQQRFSQQYQAGQAGAPGQQQQYQQYQQYQQQQQQQQQGFQHQPPTSSFGSQGPYQQQQNSLSDASEVPGAVGTSQMTTKQMQEAAKSKSKKKFGSKW